MWEQYLACNLDCMPNIMTLSQAVLKVFCSHGGTWLKVRSNKGDNSTTTCLCEKKYVSAHAESTYKIVRVMD